MRAYKEYNPFGILLLAFGSLDIIFLYHLRIKRE